MTTPNGTPAWTRAADHTYYGGHADKANYNGEPIVNPKTDIGADSIQRLATDLAAVARMADFAVLSFDATSTGSAITVTACRLMTGIAPASYAGTSPPAGFPVVRHVSAATYAVIFDGVYTDDYSVSGVFEPAFCGASVTGVQGPVVGAQPSGTSAVRVYSDTAYGSYTVWVA